MEGMVNEQIKLSVLSNKALGSIINIQSLINETLGQVSLKPDSGKTEAKMYNPLGTIRGNLDSIITISEQIMNTFQEQIKNQL